MINEGLFPLTRILYFIKVKSFHNENSNQDPEIITTAFQSSITNRHTFQYRPADTIIYYKYITKTLIVNRLVKTFTNLSVQENQKTVIK